MLVPRAVLGGLALSADWRPAPSGALRNGAHYSRARRRRNGLRRPHDAEAFTMHCRDDERDERRRLLSIDGVGGVRGPLCGAAAAGRRSVRVVPAAARRDCVRDHRATRGGNDRGVRPNERRRRRVE